MNEKKNINLRGFYNLNNFGDDLLLISILEFLNKELGFTSKNVNIYIEKKRESLVEIKFDSQIKLQHSVEFPDVVRQRLNRIFETINLPLKVPPPHEIGKNIFEEGASKKLQFLGYCIFFFLNLIIVVLDLILYKVFRKTLFLTVYFSFVENLDLIHYIGGGYFTDKWRLSLIYEFFNIFLAKTLNPGLKIIGTGLGLGPFNNNLDRKIFNFIAKRFDYLFVRENESLALIEDFKIDVYKKVLGDDVILLLPYLENLKNQANINQQNYNNIIALNLKNFPGHDYLLIKEILENYIKLIENRNYKIEYFCFGRKPGPDDRNLVEILDKYFYDNLVIHDPYEDGWTSFLEKLAKADAGLGFAYHFNVILTLLSIPTISVYSGEYYRQKMTGVMKLLSKDSIVWSIDKLAVENLVEGLDFAKVLKQGLVEDKVKHLYQEMKSEYLSAYKSLLNNIPIVPVSEISK